MTRPALGFGTAPILGRETRARSLAAIHAALDAGVRHFDTARSYGWGEAEGLLGGALAGIPREQLTIVSKCGIVPIKRTRALGLAKGAARKLLAFAPGLAGTVRRAASSSALQPKRTYDLAVLEASLRTSLAELRTPWLDLLILHNFDPELEGVEAVAAWMQAMRAEGLIRRYGFSVGDRFVETLDWLDARGLLAGAVVQAPLSAGMFATPERYRAQPVIVHSPFRCTAPEAARFAGDLGGLGDALAGQFACEAIVCSMFSPAHIRANAVALTR